jgi:putative transposase
MANYRRNFLPGGSFFFTVNLADRRSGMLTENIDRLREAFREIRARHPFTIEAIVVLPDHLHTIWTLREGDADFAMRWRQIKSAFSRRLPRSIGSIGWVERSETHHGIAARDERISNSRHRKGERGIWQRRYWEHTLRDEDDFVRHVDYIHFNPVKHGHVARVADWPHSSFHRMVRHGIYPKDWAGDANDDGKGFGER